MEEKFIPEYYAKPIIILGCGNILFGDDGFGPAVIEYLAKNYNIPQNLCLLDVGSSVRKVLFDILLSDEKPEKIIIVDAVDLARSPGEVREIPIEDLPQNKTDDFSMHQLPTSNLLRELQQLAKVGVVVITAQIERIPEEVSCGLSKALTDSLPKACEMILQKVGIKTENTKCTSGELLNP